VSGARLGAFGGGALPAPPPRPGSPLDRRLRVSRFRWTCADHPQRPRTTRQQPGRSRPRKRGELTGALACAADASVTCSASAAPRVSDTCAAQFLTLVGCVQAWVDARPPDCESFSDQDGACGLDCGIISTSCAPAVDGVNCTCTSGTMEGREFSLAACPSWSGLSSPCAYNAALFYPP
jgi:hypothetical protein